MRYINVVGAIALCVLIGSVASAKPVTMPPNAIPLMPQLNQAINIDWPTMQTRSIFGGQIEQESCVSLTSKECWNPHAELKTSREYGFGLGQITIAYNANGTQRFNNFTGTIKKYPELSSWKWDDRYDPIYQLRTIVLMDKTFYTQSKWQIANETEHYAFMLAEYNGGLGGTMQDRTLCTHTKGCDPSKWFGNVADHSFKSRTKIQGYGQSFFDINRGYVTNIMNQRRMKYIPYLEKKP